MNLASGKKIQVPFDQLIIFSTNLRAEGTGRRRLSAPHSLQDRSRRSDRRGIPRAVQVDGPQLGFEYRDEPITYLIEKHYRAVGRPLRCCQPRDLLLQVRNNCLFEGGRWR